MREISQREKLEDCGENGEMRTRLRIGSAAGDRDEVEDGDGERRMWMRIRRGR
jgi:hypothetical protein